jgi:hypothetical protein
MKFEVSPEFKMFQSQTNTAFKEAGEAEHGVAMGCDLPVGTTGKATIIGGSAGSTKAKVVAGQPVPAKPYLILEFEIVLPESHKGRKYSRYFDISNHEKFTTAQKISQWWDWMEDAGCPNEIRKTGDPVQGFNWAGSETRMFDFIIESGYNGRKDIKATPPMGQLPAATSTQQAMAAASLPGFMPQQPTGFQPGQTVSAFGQQWEVVQVMGDKCVLKNPTSGSQMPGVPVASLSAV